MEAFRRMTVAITGTLGKPRAEIAAMIDATVNARWVEKVHKDTDYLVAARMDTAKARMAAVEGATIITEEELNQYLTAGRFPWRKHRDTHVSNWPELTWTEFVEAPELFLLTYKDAEEVLSTRYIRITKYGHNAAARDYFEAWDGIQLKTYRRDRIIEMIRINE
jgi:hypothetical protein